MELGRQIKQHRKERGLSQEDLAAAIYVARQTVSNWETDRTYPDVENLLLLSDLFDVTVDELIKGDVEAMKEAISNDYRKMVWFSWIGLVVAIGGAVFAIAGITMWDWDLIPSVIAGFSLWGVGMAIITHSERIKKEHDLVTFQEILAFSKGEPVDRDNPKSQQARQHRALKILLMALSAAIVGFVAGYLMYKTGMVS